MSDDSVVILTLAAAISAGTPLALAGLGELVTERSGILNLGVEGMMLIGAVTAVLVAHGSGIVWAPLLAGMVAGAALASVHAFLSITLRANQIVSGLALVIFGTGLAIFLGRSVEGQPLATRITRTDVPLARDLPIAGPILFQQDVAVYASWILTLIAAVYLFRTRAGLAVRAVGESPATADAMGVRVGVVRYIHTIFGGLLAGAGGAYIVLARVPTWLQDATTGGVGWIAIALVVFSSWRPARLLLGSYFFGAALRANFVLQTIGVRVPAEFLSMVPYLLTILVVFLVARGDLRRRLGAPAALGAPYVREQA